MAAAANHLRRLVASIMLAAMASFVLHGAAMARFHAHAGSAQCQTASAHGDHSKAHEHGDGIVHVHGEHAASAAGHDHGGAPDHHAGGTDGPCCSSICSVTLAIHGINPVSAPMRLVRALPPESQVGSGIDQGGLKRPPRTPSIA